MKNMMKKPEAVTQNVMMVGADGQPLPPPGQAPTNQQQSNIPLMQLGASENYETSLDSVRDFVKEEPKLAAQVAKNWVGTE